MTRTEKTINPTLPDSDEEIINNKLQSLDEQFQQYVVCRDEIIAELKELLLNNVDESEQLKNFATYFQKINTYINLKEGKEVSNNSKEIESLNQQINDKKNEIAELNIKLEEKTSSINDLKQKLDAKEPE